MELAEAEGNTSLVKELKENGEPPYDGSDVTWRSMPYLNYLNGIMQKNPEIHNSGYQTMRDIGSEEYSVFDKVYSMDALMNTFNHVYP